MKEELLTPEQKAAEMILNLGIENAIYTAKEILIVLEDIKDIDNVIKDWNDVLYCLENCTDVIKISTK